MKVSLIWITSFVAISIANTLAASIDQPGWKVLATIGYAFLVQALFIQRYPRGEAIRQMVKLKKGARIEVEGR